MSVKVDTERSTKARTEGNASFKKGKWTEAIGHYTTAIVFNPQDGLGYTNRAAAYLKLEKWKDAERDCSSAITLPKGDINVKALYRRSLARKALQDVAGALMDIQAVLAIEPNNETAREEQTDLQELLSKQTQKSDETVKKAKDLPPSPPRMPAEPIPASESATIEEIEDHPEDTVPVKALDTSLKQAEAARTSFADLKKGRQSKKTFTTTTSISPDIPAQSVKQAPTTASSPSPSTLPIEKISISETSAPAQAQPMATPSRSDLSSETLPLLDPTVSGSALSLMNAIRTHSAEATWPVITDLSKRPESVGKMLDNFLEPAQLATILARLQDTMNLDLATKEERQKVVVDLMAGMRMTKRWGMTAMMLSSKEKQLGQDVWTSVGGTGDWTKKT